MQMTLELSSKKKTMYSVQNDHIQASLIFDALKVSELAAIAAAQHIGGGNEKAADQAAVDAMRQAFNEMPIDGEIVIGEGERDEAPMLYIGEKVGTQHGPQIDIALDPLEGTTLTAKGLPNALAVLALAPRGGFLNAPDVYMQKIAVGAGLPVGVVSLNYSAHENIKRLAKAKNVATNRITVCVLERERHNAMIDEIRATGARVILIPDGDVYGIIATTEPQSGIDLYMGSGGAPEGVLAAAALTTLGGQMQGQLLFHKEIERERATKLGISDFDKIYDLKELAHGDTVFIATGVTDGSLLKGIQEENNTITVNSLVLHKASQTKRKITTSYTRPISNLNRSI
jgi:fructose-1,6-bisphosphatase II / sedoheptulose-1,7-bisphosphatase